MVLETRSDRFFPSLSVRRTRRCAGLCRLSALLFIKVNPVSRRSRSGLPIAAMQTVLLSDLLKQHWTLLDSI